MTTTHASLLSGYRPPRGVFDELVDADGVVREHWRHVSGALDQLGSRELAVRAHEIRRQLEDDGVSYHVHGDDQRQANAWHLDAVPVVLPSDEWARLESGVIQRAELLDLVLTDLYGPRDLVRRGLLPPEVVLGHAGFLRAADGIGLPGPSQLVTLAVDIGRDADGGAVVLADRAQAPSGAGYALQNRLVMSRVFPSLYRTTQVHRLAPFFRSLRAALQAAAPEGVEDPRIVVLSPGPHNETAFEHAMLASTLGYSLVEGADLVARHGRIWLRSLDALEPVDVVLRRVDAAWCDPLELRGDSQLGVPGLVEAARRGAVSIVNPLGAGVLENPGLLPFLPALCRELLGQDLRLPSARTLWCGDPAQRAEVEARLDELVLKPIVRRQGPTHVFGGELGTAGRDRLRARIAARPHLWVGQERVELGVAPTLVNGGLVSRRSVLRTFAVARDESFAVMPGGLTRVAGDDGIVVTNQRGAGSKDTWVLTSEPESASGYWLRPGGADAPVSPSASMSARAAENLFWLGRYAERAEGLVRLLRVVEERRTDLLSAAHGAHPAGPATVDLLLQALGRVTATGPLVDPDTAEGDLDAATLRWLLTDPARPGTLAFALEHVESSAQVVRDQLSRDTWLVLTSLDRELTALTERGATEEDLLGHGRLGRVLTGLLALQGLATESMVRDPGWRFMDAGRRLERGQHLLALLRATVVDQHDTAVDSLLYESVLTATESIVTYRRRYRSRAQLATMLDLLLLDPDNPRSLAHQLDQLGRDLQALPGHPGPGRVGPSERPVLDAATALRLADTRLLSDAVRDGRREGLDQLLGTLEARLRAASDAIDVGHFTHLKPQRSVGVGGVSPTAFEREVETA